MPDTLYENHLKGEYAVERGDSVLIITARSCYTVAPEAAWLVAELPGTATLETYGRALAGLGLNEPGTILDRLVGIGVLRPKPDAAILKKLVRSLLAPNIRLASARWQENALRRLGLHPSEGWLNADSVLLLLPLAALCLGIVVFAPGSFAILTQMSAGHPNVVAIVLVLLLGGLVHEAGHSLTAAACGIGLRPIGFSLYLFFPVFYANVSGMENLPLRRKVAIDCGGLVFQSGFLLMLGVVWAISRNITILESVRWMALVMLFNLNPLLRTDAYWLYRDLRTELPRNRIADAFHLVYLVAFSGFTVYLFYRVFEGIGPILSIVTAGFERPSIFLTEGYKIILGIYFVVLVGTGGLARFKESRKELRELRRQETPETVGRLFTDRRHDTK